MFRVFQGPVPQPADQWQAGSSQTRHHPQSSRRKRLPQGWPPALRRPADRLAASLADHGRVSESGSQVRTPAGPGWAWLGWAGAVGIARSGAARAPPSGGRPAAATPTSAVVYNTRSPFVGWWPAHRTGAIPRRTSHGSLGAWGD